MEKHGKQYEKFVGCGLPIKTKTETIEVSLYIFKLCITPNQKVFNAGLNSKNKIWCCLINTKVF